VRIAVAEPFIFNSLDSKVTTTCSHLNELQSLHVLSINWILKNFIENLGDFGCVKNWLIKSQGVRNFCVHSHFMPEGDSSLVSNKFITIWLLVSKMRPSDNWHTCGNAFDGTSHSAMSQTSFRRWMI
jgi:hypothetical protein